MLTREGHTEVMTKPHQMGVPLWFLVSSHLSEHSIPLIVLNGCGGGQSTMFSADVPSVVNICIYAFITWHNEQQQ